MSHNIYQPPKVFISYSWDSDKHKDDVLNLADRLRNDGIDCNIDQYEVSPPEGWLYWMRNQIEQSDFVLAVCTEQYKRRFQGKTELGTEKSFAWEGAIISQLIYDRVTNTKFIPVIFSPQEVSSIPTELRRFNYYLLDTENLNLDSHKGYEALYRHLTNQPRNRKPKLGKLRSLSSLEKSLVSESSQDEEAQPPKVFISYSWDSDKHEDDVLNLANCLRNDGIDCNIDQYEISPPEGLLHWMRNQIEQSDFVLVVCTEQYKRRFQGKEELGTGKGVTWKGAIISQLIYDRVTNTKFIPVIFSPQEVSSIPPELLRFTYYLLDTENLNLDSNEGYENLYRHLINQPRNRKDREYEFEEIQQKKLTELYDRARRFSRARQWKKVITIFQQMREENLPYFDPDGLYRLARDELVKEQQQKERVQREQERKKRELENLYNQGVRSSQTKDWHEARMSEKFDVFLCHNSQDKPEVREIARQLQQQELKPWLDEWELRPGLSWQELLEEQIEQIKSAAVFVGSSGFGPWQKREMRAFLNEFVDRGCPVIPVLLENAPQEPKLPIFLKSLTWVDFRKSKSNPMGRLIWGITGIKPNVFNFSQSSVSHPSKTSTIEKEKFEFDVVMVNDRGLEIKREPGQARYFTEDLGNGVTLDMVYIPGDTFLMGSPEYDAEKPQHEVTVQPFFMGKFQVTQAQWRAIASREDLKVERDLDPNPAYFKDGSDSDRRPVEQVSWEDAEEFCQRLSKQTGKKYRLPSEAEWEYACRAGTITPFHFGETISSDLANYKDNYTYANEPKEEYRQESTPVGNFLPNAFGLYDMHGNVWEWCEDDWHDNYNNAPSDGRAWLSEENNKKVIRGGAWDIIPEECGSAVRYDFSRDIRINIIGFRVVCVASRTT